jgi:hypothetical protein
MPTNKDRNGIEIKEGHSQSKAETLPMGEKVWLLKRIDDKVFGAWESRHEAIGAAVKRCNSKEEWFEPIQVRTGTVRMLDVVYINE